MSALQKFFSPTTASQPAEMSVASRIDHLTHVRLFHDIAGDTVAMHALADLVEVRVFPAASAIIEEGQDGTEAYFLIEGTVKVLKTFSGNEAFPVALLEAKDNPFFGEAALLQKDQRSATIFAETPCTCLVLLKSDFDPFCTEHPHWALPILRRISIGILERLHRANRDVVLLYNALVSEVKG